MPERGRFEDKTLVCNQCRRPFVFKAGEQEFYESKGLNEPKRCPPCRQERRHKGVYGKQVVPVNSHTGEVLCKRCAKPASKSASLKKGEAICWACTEGPMYGDAVTPNEDRLYYEEWESHFSQKGDRD